MKKWSYAAAMMLALAGGSIFTGCIDNDEPLGIQEVRFATAELLKAKAVAAEAEKAANEVKLEIAKIEAEVAKMHAEAELESIKSQERINQITAEAAAAKDKAEAEKILAQADSIRTAAQAMYESVQAEIKNKRDIVDKKLEFADQKLTELKYNFAKAQLKDADNRKSRLYSILEGAYTQYIYALEAYNAKLNEIAEAQVALDEAKVDLKWVWKDDNNHSLGGYWLSPKYDSKNSFELLINHLTTCQNNINNDIELLNEAKTQLENAKASDLYALLEEYTKAKNDLELTEKELKVEEDAIRINNAAAYDAIAKALDAVNEYKNKDIAIAPYVFTPSAVEAGIFPETVNDTVVPENVTYTLNDVESNPSQNNYTKYLNKYSTVTNQLKAYLLDDNDIAWTNARLVEMKRQLESGMTAYNKANGYWQTAVKVYNGGDKPNAEALPENAAVNAAIDAYNAYKGTFNDAKKVFTDAQTVEQQKNDALFAATRKFETDYPGTPGLNAWTAANATYEQALENAQDAYNTSVNNAASAKSNVYSTQDGLVADAQKTLADRQAEQLTAQSRYDADATNTTLLAALNTAKTNTANAETALKNAQTAATTAKATADKTYTSAVAEADRVKTEADSKALNALNRAYATWTDLNASNESADYAAVETAMTEVNDAAKNTAEAKDAFDAIKPDFKKLYVAMTSAIDKQENAMGYKWSNKTWPVYDVNTKDWEAEVLDFTPATYPVMYQNSALVYANAKQYLIDASKVAYGYLGNLRIIVLNPNNGQTVIAGYDGTDKSFEVDKAFLVNITPEMINNYISTWYKKTYNAEISAWQIPNYYFLFGEYGDVLTLQNNIAKAEASLSNSDLSNDLVAGLVDARAEMVKVYNAAVAGVEPLEEAADKAQKDYDALYVEVNAKIAEVQALLIPYKFIVNDLNAAVQTLLSIDVTSDKVDINTNETAIKAIADAIAELDTEIESDKAKLQAIYEASKRAQYQLAQVEAGIANAENDSAEQIKIDYLNEQAELLKERVEFYSSRVADLTKAYEDALGKTAE